MIGTSYGSRSVGESTSSRWGPAPAIAFLVLVFVLVAAIRWTSQPPIGSDCDEHRIVARTFIDSGHFSVADVHATKYPPLVSSLAILFSFLSLSVPLSLVVVNFLAVLGCSLAVYFMALRNSRLGFLAVLPAIYLMTNTALWASANEIMADALLVMLVAVALLLALNVEEWTPRMIFAACALTFTAAMTKSIGFVIGFPLAAAIVWERRQRGRSFPYAALALLILLPVAGLGSFMAYEVRFGPHPTGYLETFMLNDPFDAAKGSLTPLGLLARTARGTITSLKDARDLMVYPSSPGVFTLAAAIYPSLAGVLSLAALVGLFVFALDRDRRRVLVLAAFIVPCAIAVSLWPYKGARFMLPLLPVAALGVGGATAASLQSRRFVAVLFMALLLSHVIINTVNLRRQAGEWVGSRTLFNSQFAQLAEWCKANIPEDETIASPDYRELMLRVGRPVMPVPYSSDAEAQIAQLAREGAKWFVFCYYIFPTRADQAEGILAALGDRAVLRFSNESCEVHELDLVGYERQGAPTPGTSGRRAP